METETETETETAIEIMDRDVRCREACWLCGGVLDEVYWELPTATRDYNTRYVRCGGCGLVTVSPYLADQAIGLTHPDHANYVNDAEVYCRNVSIEGFLYLLRKLEAAWWAAGHAHRGQLLEIGSAAGYFLDGARARDWAVTGIEPAEPVALWSQQYLQLPVHCGFFDQLDLPDAGFDVIASIEVLEHVLNPLEFLERVHRKLRPGGMTFLTTPNVYSPHYHPPEPSKPSVLAPLDHLNLFSTDTLAQLLERAGFIEVSTESHGPDGLQLLAYGHKAA